MICGSILGLGPKKCNKCNKYCHISSSQIAGWVAGDCQIAGLPDCNGYVI